MILQHGIDTYQNQFDQSIISSAVRRLEFGYISFTKKAKIKRKRTSKVAENNINGFVLCMFDPISYSIEIMLFCISEQYKGAEKELLEEVIKYAESRPDVHSVMLKALPESLEYYLKYKFTATDIVRVNNTGEIKVYVMSRPISHEK